jgi:hypothetical protein
VAVLDAHCPFVVEVGDGGALGVWLGPAALELELVDVDRLDRFLHARVRVESATDAVGIREERCTVHAALGHDAVELRRRARTDAPRGRVSTRSTEYGPWLDALGR